MNASKLLPALQSKQKTPNEHTSSYWAQKWANHENIWKHMAHRFQMFATHLTWTQCKEPCCLTIFANLAEARSNCWNCTISCRKAFSVLAFRKFRAEQWISILISFPSLTQVETQGAEVAISSLYTNSTQKIQKNTVDGKAAPYCQWEQSEDMMHSKAFTNRQKNCIYNIPVVPARGGAEVALKIYIRPFSSIELACAVRQPSPCVRALCETGVLFHMSHLKLHFTLHTALFTVHTSHFTVHTSHFTLHTSHFTLHTSHFTLHTSHCTHLSSSHLIPAHFFSSHLFSYVSKAFMNHFQVLLLRNLHAPCASQARACVLCAKLVSCFTCHIWSSTSHFAFDSLHTPPHRRGSFHRRLQQLYTEKHKVSCSGFLPNTQPMQHHAAIPMQSATRDSRTA